MSVMSPSAPPEPRIASPDTPKVPDNLPDLGHREPPNQRNGGPIAAYFLIVLKSDRSHVVL